MSAWWLRFLVGAGLCALLVCGVLLAAYLGGAALALLTIGFAATTGLSDTASAYIVVITVASIFIGVFWANFAED